MNALYETFPTPFGPFTVAVNERGAVIATAFGHRQRLAARLGNCHLMDDNIATRAAREQVLEYSSGGRIDFTVPLAAAGTEFQHRVWSALQAIPCGQTRSYGELAASLGNARASRAVGRANATNPICLIVPCHRVIGRDGSLTGFAFGEAIKRQLLEHERKLIGRRIRAA
jgi:methylated-DNA-[protein]-cysteine S-methyltransferase